MTHIHRETRVGVGAFLMTSGSRRDPSSWPRWLREVWDKETSATAPDEFTYTSGLGSLRVVTLHGVLRVAWEGYLIRGDRDELYACAPHVFALTYEAI